ncbi:BRCT domain-containing protein [Streptomyces sp. NPDC012935]|uniref:BRCT domain-containing protein n=1 Tax=Streptomyces sp. NPDC012935 TaxID=3364857 RepID=UPI003693F402
MKELIERARGRSSSSVSKKTTLVVAGESAGSKRAKTEDHGIRPATPDEFATLAVRLPHMTAAVRSGAPPHSGSPAALGTTQHG